jgi:hypothetical protein
MTPQELNTIRAEELRRRVFALPTELDAWIARSVPTEPLKIHMTQVRALKILIDGLVAAQIALVDRLSGDAPDFASRALRITRELIRAQRIWDFFRTQLSLRFSEDFQQLLWIADTIAWNCHRSVLEAAQLAGILTLDAAREPPLTYVVADVSPLTYVRGSAPLDGDRLLLGNAVLPIPIIHVPPDQLVNAWELLTIAHEVGHDLEKDLGIEDALKRSLAAALPAAGRPERLDVWQLWRAEVFADLVAAQLVGPAFGRALLAVLTLPESIVTTFNPADEHPTPYTRILFIAKFARTLVAADADPAVAAARLRMDADAAALEAQWKALYTQAPPEAAAFLDDAPHVWTALMNTAFVELKNHTVRELMPFKAADDARIRAAASFLATGQNAPNKGNFSRTIRHCVAAAQLAVDFPAPADLKSYLVDVDARTRDLVRDNTPDVVRGTESKSHGRFLAEFATAILREAPL